VSLCMAAAGILTESSDDCPSEGERRQPRPAT
jgi:hypothetical protein